jgi:hypothetical protein
MLRIGAALIGLVFTGLVFGLFMAGSALAQQSETARQSEIAQQSEMTQPLGKVVEYGIYSEKNGHLL